MPFSTIMISTMQFLVIVDIWAFIDRIEEYIPHYDDVPIPRNFFSHAAYWDILLQRVPEELSDSIKCSMILHHLLYCTMWNRYRCIRSGHDSGDSTQFQKPAG